MPELAGLTLVPVGERQPHGLLVPAVHPLVAAVAADQQQSDADRLEDRLQGLPLVLDLRGGRLEPLLVLLLLGHVEDLRDEVQRVAVGPAHQRHREVTPDHVSVRVQVALAQPVGVDLPGQRPVEEREVGVEVVDVGELLEAPLGEVSASYPSISDIAWLTISSRPSRPTIAIPIGECCSVRRHRSALTEALSIRHLLGAANGRVPPPRQRTT